MEIADPYCFDDEIVESKIFEIIEKLGVNVMKEYQIEDIVTKGNTI